MISLVSTVETAKGRVLDKFHETEILRGTTLLKRGFAHMLKHGVVMDVTNVEQAKIAEAAGAVAVMVLDKLPYDVRKAGGVARTASPKAIKEILDNTTIPVMAKCRIGHTSEARVLEELGVDMVDESEVLTPADEERHIWKWDFTTPFVCGGRNLGEALRRIEEGAAMIRTKGLVKLARELNVSLQILEETAKLGRLPVVNFAAGGITTPADAALMMNLGCDGVFVGSGVFKSEDPDNRARSIVLATTYHDQPQTVTEAQAMVDEKRSMGGLDVKNLEYKMQERGTT